MKHILALVCFFWFSACLHAAEAPLRVFIRAGVKTHGPGQHDHPSFLRDWQQLLNQRGLKAEGGMKFPTAEQLENTDVVVVFAADGMNIVGQDRANFEKFLQRGGGLVVLHDGVVSADQHEWAKKVQGGAWIWPKNAPGKTGTKWYEGEVGVYFVDTTHPITRGISNFDWKDEVYYDLDMAPDVKVLATSFQSVFIIAPQLWTYEKTWEGGSTPYRAFVSIPGHEYVSFNTPHYRALLLRGIAWAGKRENVDSFCKPEELASLAYPPGGPTAPREAARKITVDPEFNIHLVAAEPLIEKAISLDWDPQGHLWVAETPEYPSGRTINANDRIISHLDDTKPQAVKGRKVDRPAKDRISWLEDTDGDGVMDKKHVFYEGLELVTSLVFYKDGVIVAQAPDILWIRDTDGDGKADRVETLITGFGTGDTHAVINNFRWGMDGWVYGAVGYSGGHPKSGDGNIDFGTIGSAIFRFKPDGKAFEVLASTACNTWGFDFGWDNEMYYSTPTCGDHALHIALPEKILARGSVGGNIRAQNAMQDHNRVKPLVHHTRPAYVQIDVVGGFTAAAGSCLYVGGAWPEKYNNTYFVSEPTVSLVHQDFLSPKGATFVASKDKSREDSEFIAGTDLWFRPIHTRVGPDGALYVIDFYNQAVIHNDTRGPRHGANNAATRPDRDHHFGRIWRVQHNDARTLPKYDFSSNAGLAKALEHPNGWVRMTAQRLLFEKNDAAVAPALAKLLRSSSSAAARIHSLWALNDLDKLDDRLLLAAVQDKNSAVRKNALRVMAEKDTNEGNQKLNAIQAQLKDDDGRVRLQALVALQTFAPTPAVAKAVVAAWPTLSDKYLESAALGVAAKDPVLFAETALAANAGAAHESFIRHVTRQLAQKGNPADVARFIETLAKAPAGADGQKQIALTSLSENLTPNLPVEWSQNLQQAFKTLVSSENPSVAGAALPLVARWDKNGSLSPELRPMVKLMAAKLASGDLSDNERGQIAANLIGVRQIDPATIPAVARLLGPGYSPALQKRVIEAMGAAPDPAIGAALVSACPTLSADAREAAFGQIIRRSDWSLQLVQSLAEKRMDLLTLGPSAIHRLRNHSDKMVAKRADDAITAIRGPEQQEKDKIIAQLLPVVEKPGNLENGKKLFTQNCLVCHTFKNQGRNVAPDLTGMGVHGAHELLVHIVDPNRVVEPNYVAISVETKDDNSYDGVIASDNRTSIKLRNATGDIEIRKDNIKSQKSTGRSLMPEGFDALGGETLRDIIAYISADNARFRLIDLSAAYNADSTKGIYRSKESASESVHLKKFGLVTAGQIPFQIADPARTPNGNNLLVLKGRNDMARTYSQRVELPVPNLTATKIHVLGGVGGWAWPYGGEETKGTPVAKLTVTHADGQSEIMTLTNGVHVVDYNNASLECPGSKQIPGLVTSGQLRLITQTLKGTSPVTKVTLESFNNAVAPTFVAVTAETADTTAVANK